MEYILEYNLKVARHHLLVVKYKHYLEDNIKEREEFFKQGARCRTKISRQKSILLNTNNYTGDTHLKKASIFHALLRDE